MTEEINKYKLYYLQKKYNNLINKINNLEDHFNVLLNNYIIDNQVEFSNKIYDIIKKINSQYNVLINNYLENNNTEIDNLYQKFKNDNLIPIIDNYIKDFPNTIFVETENELNILIIKYGYTNIKSLIEILYEPNYFNKNIIDLINDINDVAIPISYNIFTTIDDNISNDYFWKMQNKNTESTDLLQKKRELWIKLHKSNKYLKIDIIFKIDKFSCKSKTSQLNSPLLHKLKTNIFNKLECNDSNSAETEFIKTFIRHDYLGNLYCMTYIEYIDYVKKMYNKFTKLSESTFVNIMKEFVNNENVKKMYEIIFLLLLGSDETIDTAGLLIGLLKDKKNKSSINLFELMFNNMNYYIQSKIKKSNINIKNSIEKLKTTFGNNTEEIDYKKQLAVSKNIPNNVKALVLEKIEEMKSFNNEYYKQLLFVKTILNFPWSSANDDLFYQTMSKNKKQAMEYLNNVENKLNTSCYGHVEAKKLLLQMIGKWISNPSSIGTCFGLVGPPGVGKTLLAKSVSKALDIPFGQITLGGQNDGEILHGHGYTYSGSQPGMVIKKMVEMGKSRCILYFDELDKACSKHGTINEITSILIHLTDPNMNKSFQDRFFQGIEFPLDKVIIIFSYNDSSLVDPILLDRIKEITVKPYTMDDKLNICTKHIIPEMAENVSMEDLINIDEENIKYLIDNYTNEAGVRDIKRKIEDIYLHLNIEKIYNKGLFLEPVSSHKTSKKHKKINLTIDKIKEILKEPDMYRKYINTQPAVGIINGLYATPNGTGGITYIQIYPNLIQSHDNHTNHYYNVKLTGKQGEVMKESVLTSLTTAIEWLKSPNGGNINVEEFMKKYVKNGFHIHTPDGSTPKDGPSAGCAFTTAFISRIINKPIPNDIAMTGEIDLTGKISKIGGLEYKLQGAKKAGVKKVYIPFENLKDLNEIKEKYKNLIDDTFVIITVNHISDIINNIFPDIK
jgi:endopeptidase La